jgi:quercetin dioxygenase-like cupin family protein
MAVFLLNILNRNAMKWFSLVIVALLIILCTSCNNAGKNTKNESDQTSETIFPKGEKITNDNFTGGAWLHQMITADSMDAIQVGNVTFEPGARTNWHVHPAGQILLITGGTGYYQEKAGAKRIIKKGEVVKCPPGVPHWHGASRDEELIQIAITNTQKGAPVWLEKVTDEEYNK